MLYCGFVVDSWSADGRGIFLRGFGCVDGCSVGGVRVGIPYCDFETREGSEGPTGILYCGFVVDN